MRAMVSLVVLSYCVDTSRNISAFPIEYGLPLQISSGFGRKAKSELLRCFGE